ncbi:MAG: TPM domain-containing protein [Bacteroidales bacterium]|nr:TPM domain-containing protein [Bacteroidales bacterium]
MINKRYIIILVSVLIAHSQLVSSTEVPYLTGRVNDNARILSDNTRESLSETLKENEIRTTNQIVILTLASLEGENIEDFANRVFNEWKLGQEDKDNGILIIVVPGERRMRIEVGYGLEGILTDLEAAAIIDKIMAPAFRGGDYDSGISGGVSAVITILEGGDVPAIEEAGKEAASPGDAFFSDFENPELPFTARILLGGFIFGILGLFTAMGIINPGAGRFLYFFLIPFWAMFPIVVLGSKGALICFLTYLIGFPVAKLFLRNKDWYKKAKEDLRTKGRASIGGFAFSTGSSGGSWSSGSSGSHSSFSGGGGSSGGGGASGSW